KVCSSTDNDRVRSATGAGAAAGAAGTSDASATSTKGFLALAVACSDGGDNAVTCKPSARISDSCCLISSVDSRLTTESGACIKDEEARSLRAASVSTELSAWRD